MITYLVQCYFPGPRSFFNKKEVHARDLLGSCASDIDLILDWWFYVDTYTNEEVSKEIPDVFRKFHLFFTILGTLTWFCLASDGRAVDWFIIQPLRLLECICNTWRRCCFGPKKRIGGSNKTLPKVKELWEEAQSEDNWKLSDVQISTGFLLFCGIVLEDIPQIIITFLCQEYKQEALGRKDSEAAGLVIANMLTSIYNALIKLADAYDQRKDIVSVSDRS